MPRYFSFTKVLFTLITLFCFVLRISVEQVRRAWVASRKRLNTGIVNTSSAIKAVWSRHVRRLRPKNSKDSLAESPVFRFGHESDSKFDGITGQSDKVLSQEGSFLSEVKRSSLASYQPEQIREMQRDDPDVGKVVAWTLHSEEKPSRDIVAGESPYVRHLWLLWDQLCFKDGVLFKQRVAHKGTESYLQLVLPTVLKKQVLESTHSAICSGHLGVQKTASKIQRMFYWYQW